MGHTLLTPLGTHFSWLLWGRSRSANFLRGHQNIGRRARAVRILPHRERRPRTRCGGTLPVPGAYIPFPGTSPRGVGYLGSQASVCLVRLGGSVVRGAERRPPSRGQYYEQFAPCVMWHAAPVYHDAHRGMQEMVQSGNFRTACPRRLKTHLLLFGGGTCLVWHVCALESRLPDG